MYRRPYTLDRLQTYIHGLQHASDGWLRGNLKDPADDTNCENSGSNCILNTRVSLKVPISRNDRVPD